jgi:hypothetical protein
MDTNQKDDKRWQDTLAALESVEAGRVVDGGVVHEWLETWDTPQEIWADEAEKRLRAYREGRLTGIPMEDVFASETVADKLQCSIERVECEGTLSQTEVETKLQKWLK